MDGQDEPVVCRFYRLINAAPSPRRADRSADGMLPVRGYRYCEALASASAFGWSLYPPLHFSLVWDGVELAWTYEGADGWYPLRGAQYPGFRQWFEEVAPEAVKTLAPPFLVALVSTCEIRQRRHAEDGTLASLKTGPKIKC